MLKRHSCSSSVEHILKRHRRSWPNLPEDVVELILERLSVESLVKFKSVCKKWKSTMESKRFQDRQFILGRQSRGEDVLFVSIMDYSHSGYEAGRSRIVLGSSVFRTVKFPILSTEVCQGSCDGLICLTDVLTPSFVINPATGWRTSFPHSSLQQLQKDRYYKGDFDVPSPKLGFGKDKVTDTYKPVWLYNSSEFGLDNETTCEVFDFGTNSWRYVLPASPYRIVSSNDPVYLDGSLYWLSECQHTKVLSFHLHTETFRVISQTHFYHFSKPVLSVLDNRLCISVQIYPDRCIFSLSGNNKTWEKMFEIDLDEISYLFGVGPLSTLIIPVAILDKNKLLLRAQDEENDNLLSVVVIHDLHTKSYDLFYRPTSAGCCVSYFQTLFTV
uniref:F-box protein n=1 Tax=Noccaea caerulescens TaxID=107243 RepID=A0A1J3JBF5_NOCCA